VPLWLALLRTHSTTSCIYKSSKKLIAKEVFFCFIFMLLKEKNVHYIVLMIMGEVVAKRDLRDAMYASGKK
jgi:hypothetical protein